MDKFSRRRVFLERDGCCTKHYWLVRTHKNRRIQDFHPFPVAVAELERQINLTYADFVSEFDKAVETGWYD